MTFYLPKAFFVNFSRRLQSCVPAETSTYALLLYQVGLDLLLLEQDGLYAQAGGESRSLPF
ncbi:MAG: hypothetical protein RMJ60_05425, partial [Anaerolineales bacterium]|nr:hypothetical protein [Anaerolineales bacterium]